MAFKTEKELFIASQNFIKNSFRIFDWLVEPQGLFGVPDLLITEAHINKDGILDSVRIFAFEIKLKNWKRALEQAYRYRSFSDTSYVVLDKDYLNPALVNIDRFMRAKVGLISIDDFGIARIHFEPFSASPYSKYYRSKLLELITRRLTERKKIKDPTTGLPIFLKGCNLRLSPIIT